MKNPNDNSAIPEHLKDFQRLNGHVSLPFSLFLLAPPSVALNMMQEAVITDLNEKNDAGVSLLGCRFGKSAGWAGVIPSWQEWEAEGSSSWGDTSHVSNQHLLASMIFSGADPWVSWNADKTGSTSLFSSAVLQNNTYLVKLLLSHPNCPSAKELDKLKIYDYHPKKDGYSALQKSVTCGVLHVAVNMGQEDMVALLVEKGLDVNAVDTLDRTPLFYATEVSVAKKMVQSGSRLGNIDVDGQSCSVYWQSSLATAAKQADFNKIVIDKMKETTSPDDLREMQKPLLFSEIEKGTKTQFETVYRKAKFDPSVCLSHRGISYNLLSSAIIRSDEKQEMFVSWCDNKGVKWDHALSETSPYFTNALLGLLVQSSSAMGNEHALDLLFDHYNGNMPLLQKDFLEFGRELSKTGQKKIVIPVLNNFIQLAGHDLLKKSDEESPHYKKSGKADKVASVMAQATGAVYDNAPSDIMEHSDFSLAFREIVLSGSEIALAEIRESAQSYYYDGSHPSSPHALPLLEKCLMERLEGGDASVARVLPWVMMYVYANDTSGVEKKFNDLRCSLNGLKSSLKERREKISMLLREALKECEDISSDELSRLHHVASQFLQTKKGETHPSLVSFVSSMSAASMEKILKQKNGASVEAPKKKM